MTLASRPAELVRVNRNTSVPSGIRPEVDFATVGFPFATDGFAVDFATIRFPFATGGFEAKFSAVETVADWIEGEATASSIHMPTTIGAQGVDGDWFAGCIVMLRETGRSGDLLRLFGL
jgi:hypothetical protein